MSPRAYTFPCSALVAHYHVVPDRSVGILRRTIKEGRLPDGQIVPPGYTCLGDTQSVHMNPSIYPDPEVFDPFRFSKLRAQGTGNTGKYLFTGTGKDVRLISRDAVFVAPITDWSSDVPSSYHSAGEDMFGELLPS